MPLVPEYSSLSEKEEFFYNGSVPIVVNVDSIFQMFEDFISRDCFIFRGCPEAKYKLYNSAQRHYIRNELYKQVSTADRENHYHEFISNLIEECKNWNNKTVKTLLIQSKIHENNSFAYLSYMQHFGVPSPLLDFTTDPYIALFFAIDRAIYSPSNLEIDNYFSVYYADSTSMIFDSWKKTSKVLIPTLSEGNISYSDTKRLLMHILLPDGEAYRILNNTNIINQKGVFFYNNDSLEPIESTYLKYVKIMKERFGEDEFKRLLMHDSFAGCFNIHKSLMPLISEMLASKGIIKEYIFPDTYQMKNTAVHNATLKALRTKK